MKRILIFLMVLPVICQAGFIGIVNNNGTAPADSMTMPFVVLDSLGQPKIALAANDSIFLFVRFPSGAIAFQDTLPYNGTSILETSAAGIYSHGWKAAVADIDGGTAEEGAYAYDIIVKDASLVLATPNHGTFQLYAGANFDVVLDFLDQAISGIDADVWTVASRQLTALDEDVTSVDLDGITIATATNLTTNNDKTGYALSVAGIDGVVDTIFNRADVLDAALTASDSAKIARWVWFASRGAFGDSAGTMGDTNQWAQVDSFWNVAFATAFTAGSMGDSLNNATYVQGGAGVLDQTELDSLLSGVRDAKAWSELIVARDSIKAALDTLQRFTKPMTDSVQAIIDSLQLYDNWIAQQATAILARDSIYAALDSLQRFTKPQTDTLRAVIDSLQRFTKPTTDTLQALLDSIQLQDTQYTTLRDSLFAVLDSVQRFSKATTDSLQAILDSIQLHDNWIARAAVIDTAVAPYRAAGFDGTYTLTGGILIDSFFVINANGNAFKVQSTGNNGAGFRAIGHGSTGGIEVTGGTSAGPGILVEAGIGGKDIDANLHGYIINPNDDTLDVTATGLSVADFFNYYVDINDYAEDLANDSAQAGWLFFFSGDTLKWASLADVFRNQDTTNIDTSDIGDWLKNNISGSGVISQTDEDSILSAIRDAKAWSELIVARDSIKAVLDTLQRFTKPQTDTLRAVLDSLQRFTKPTTDSIQALLDSIQLQDNQYTILKDSLFALLDTLQRFSKPTSDSLQAILDSLQLYDNHGIILADVDSTWIWDLLHLVRLILGYPGSTPSWDTLAINITNQIGDYDGTAGNNIEDDLDTLHTEIAAGGGFSSDDSTWVWDLLHLIRMTIGYPGATPEWDTLAGNVHNKLGDGYSGAAGSNIEDDIDTVHAELAGISATVPDSLLAAVTKIDQIRGSIGWPLTTPSWDTIPGNVHTKLGEGYTGDAGSNVEDDFDSTRADIAALSGGSGGNVVKIYVEDDDANLLTNKIVFMEDTVSGDRYNASTDTLGYATFALDNGLYWGTVSLLGPRYDQDTIPQLFSVSSAKTDTISVTATDIVLCEVFGYVYEGGNPVRGAKIHAQIPQNYWPIYYDSVAIAARHDTRTDSLGYWSIDLYPNDLLVDSDPSDTISIWQISGMVGGSPVFTWQGIVPVAAAYRAGQ